MNQVSWYAIKQKIPKQNERELLKLYTMVFIYIYMCVCVCVCVCAVGAS